MLQKALLFTVVILGSFSSWSLFGGDTVGAGGSALETLQKLAFLGTAAFLFLVRPSGVGCHRFILPFLPFVAFTLISFILRGDSMGDIQSSLTLMIPILFGAAMVNAETPQAGIRQWRRFLMLIVIVTMVGGLFSPLVGLRSGLRNPWGGNNYQVQGLVGPSELAIYTCAIILLYLADLERLRGKDWFAMLFFLLVNLATGVRTSILALLLSALVFLPQAVRTMRRTHLVTLAIGLLLFTGLGIVRTWERTFRPEEASLAINTSKRGEFWPRYFERGKAHLFFGCGPRVVPQIMAEENIYAPHNEYLYFFVTGGVAGIGSYLFGWCYVLWTACKRNKHGMGRRVRRASLACAICLAVFALTDNCLSHVFTMCFHAGILAAAVSEGGRMPYPRRRVLRSSASLPVTGRRPMPQYAV